jgi:hypothetical protein
MPIDFCDWKFIGWTTQLLQDVSISLVFAFVAATYTAGANDG